MEYSTQFILAGKDVNETTILYGRGFVFSGKEVSFARAKICWL